jgi:ATPase subunit of ABC transporter with duplicated ATPase domains
MAPPTFIYVMKDLRKVVPPSREILRGIWLSFYDGAKIGVLGANGAGKSSLLRIMAGVDHDFQGEAWAREGTRIGYLPQEPQLDPTSTCAATWSSRSSRSAPCSTKFQNISMMFAEPMDDSAMEKLLARQSRVQEQIDAHDLWNLDNKIEIAMDALRLPPGRRRRQQAVRRRASPRRPVPGAAGRAGHAAPRRAHQPPRRGKRGLARAVPARLPGTVVAVTHDRYFLDNVAGWILELDRGYGIPYEGNYTSWLEQKRSRLAVEEKGESARHAPSARELEWVRMAPRARQAKNKARIQKYEELAAQETAEKVMQHEIVIPPPPASRQRRGDGTRSQEGVW